MNDMIKAVDNTDKLGEFYEEHWSRKASGEEFRAKCFRFASQASLASAIKDLIPVEKETLVVDVGCGSAIYTPVLSRNLRCKFIGIDVSHNALKQLLNNIKLNGLDSDVTAAVGDITQLPLKSTSFDLVICVGTLEHIPNDREALRELTRILKNGGHLFLLVPNNISWMLAPFRPVAKKFDQCGHLREYTVSNLSDLISSEGLNIVHTGSRDFFGFWVISAIERFMGQFFIRNPLGRLINKITFQSHLFTRIATTCIALYLKTENKLFRHCKFGMNNCYFGRKQ